MQCLELNQMKEPIKKIHKPSECQQVDPDQLQFSSTVKLKIFLKSLPEFVTLVALELAWKRSLVLLHYAAQGTVGHHQIPSF